MKVYSEVVGAMETRSGVRVLISGVVGPSWNHGLTPGLGGSPWSHGESSWSRVESPCTLKYSFWIHEHSPI
jgi:hypothetical protein